MSSAEADVDPSVCYRHPDRTSWTLCERCGRTICPECQILTPSGVRCPDCVRETGGSVRWEPSAGAKPARAKKVGMRRAAVAQRVDAATRPVLTIGIAGLAVVIWLIGFLSNGLPSLFLNSSPTLAVQVWRYVTTWFVYPPLGGPLVVSTLLSIFIFVFIGWGAERFFGWRRFAILVLVTGTAAAAICGIGLGGTYGLTGPIWGLAGAYLVAIWDQPAARNRLLITIAIWFLISLFLNPGVLPAMIGGAAAGIGSYLLLRHYDGRTRSRSSTPYLILAGGVAFLIVLAILSATVIAPLAGAAQA